MGIDSRITARGGRKQAQQGAKACERRALSLRLRPSSRCSGASVLLRSSAGEVRGHLCANSAPASGRSPPHAAPAWNPLGYSLLSF